MSPVTWGFEKAKGKSIKKVPPLSQVTLIKISKGFNEMKQINISVPSKNKTKRKRILFTSIV
jgi:hypothetical protein